MNITKEQILNLVTDSVSDLLYYDRQEDDDIGVEDIEKAIIAGIITVDEITEHFRTQLYNNYMSLKLELEE